ncbi:two-component regulator propeller domain-containing protein [Massilia sp. HP4]|uniref:sensor histidine kinase n=1 Tax=Massilia sp. HP4 TaxID=2562316 RepID=UPI0010C0064C|nr:two-component regulator propeller domain-containing protein [Massilia sp. HP4]
MPGFTSAVRARLARHGLLLLLCLSTTLAACLPAGAAQRSLRFERLSVDDGLSQHSVINILQDRQGFIWFGTQAGLHRFDGYRLTVYRNDTNDPGSLPDNYVSASYEDPDGYLWFGTKGGLARYDPASGRFQRHALLDAGRSVLRSVVAIVPGPDGALWLATTDGVVRFDPASGQHQGHVHDPEERASLRDNRVNTLAFDNAGALWVGTASGLDRMDPGSGRFTHFAVAPPADTKRNTVLALSMGPRATLWVGTASGLEAWRLDEGEPRRQRIGAANGLGEVHVRTLYHDGGAQLWVGTENDGLKWRDPSSGNFISYRNAAHDPHSLSDNQVPAVLVDRTGTLWVGTYFGGINRTDLASGGFARYGDTDGIGRARVRAITDAPDGRLWVGTVSDGLMLLDPVTRRAERIRAGALLGDRVTALANARGRLWIGTATGLLWREPGGRMGRVALGPGPSANHVQAIRAGRDGALWVTTRDGLSALAPGHETTRSWRNDPLDPTSLGDNYGRALLEDRHGIVWIGTESGLERFDRATDTFTRFRSDPADPGSLRHSRVNYLYESGRGELWVGTAGGLHRMMRDGARTWFRFYPFAEAEDAPSIGAILEDDDGNLWVSTTAGITRVDPVNGQTKSYTAKDGLIDGSYFVGSGWRGANGQLHFGGISGMTSFQPAAVRDNPFPPAVTITDLLVLNKTRAIPDLATRREITLSHRDTVFTLEFAALHYADPQGNRYAYRLEGFDQGWVDTNASRRFATYTNLDPGRYVFRVRASNKDGLWSQEAAALAITITPPYWKTWWFRTLIAAAVLALSYLAYRMRVRALVEQKGLLAREVHARTAELLLQKEAAERGKREVERQKESVERAHRNIALLSDMGRVLTAKLDNEAIMRTLYQHVVALMDAPVFAVALWRPERETLELPYAMVVGRRMAPRELRFDPARHLLSCCVAEGRDFVLADVEAELPACLAQPVSALDAVSVSGTAAQAPRSLLCVPVTVGERVLGAVTVQSREAGAYGQVHLDMLGTLAAYVGVAMDNADAYERLKETQAQLAAQEKMASLGSLVAGVAHELNTPIGNSLLMASTLQERTGAVAARFAQATLKRSDLEDYMAASREASELIVRSLHSAAELVSSFRQVSVDQASAQRRRFDLSQACHEIAATLMNTVRLAEHRLVLDVPAGIAMDGFPGALGQVLINFVNNAMLHAFEGPGGTMTIGAALHDGRVTVTFRDDGRGIETAHLGRIFDPFFTTRMGQGGTGLGLNIVYNIVTTLLGGTIRVDSTPGAGTVFVLDLPLRAPDAPAGEARPA